MKTDIPTTAPPPPTPVVSPVERNDVPTVTPTFFDATVAQLTQELEQMLRASHLSKQTTGTAEDGSVKIPSLVAVYLISQVGVAVGRPKFVDLAHVDRDSLRSVAGIAQLVHRTLHPAPAAPMAS